MNNDGVFIHCNVGAVRKYIHGLIRHASLRKLLFLLASVFICSFFVYLWWYCYYYNQSSSFHITRNGHFVRFLDSKAQHVDCPQKNRFILAEEQRIFQSIRREHIGLVKEFAKKKAELDSVLLELANGENDLRELNLHISQLQMLQRELNDKRNVKLSLPNAPLVFEPELKAHRNSTGTYDIFDQCIDYRRCSISSPFRFYLYNRSPMVKAESASNGIHDELLASPFRTDDANRACIFVAIHDSGSSLAKLKYWLGDGRNHLLLINGPLKPDTREFGAAAVVSNYHAEGSYRSGIDIAVELNVPSISITEYQRLPQLLPYAREHLLAFMAPFNEMSAIERSNLIELQRSANASGDSFDFDLSCVADSDTIGLCHDEKRRVSLLRRSHFALVLASHPPTQTRFREALLAGAIPVVVGRAALPFDELIDWRLAAVHLAAARLPELHFVLRSISVADLLEMRRKGRMFLESYLANSRVLSRAILSVMRYRLHMPTDGAPSTRLDVSNDTSSSFPSTATRPPYDDEYLGPLEPPISSPSFTHNSTVLRMYSYKLWNELPSHVDFTPEYFSSDASMPSEAEFDEEASFGMRPIAPGSGQEFANGLGGNRQREQFTIVIVTHNRDAVLNASLERLHQLPYLSKVLVVWNNVDRPNDLSWPRIHVPIVFLRAERNSLNNRFLPLRDIETEAVLSLDDDIDLKQHEIIFAFRTWRENRHRLVGFPARYHAKYGDSMTYNSNHTCQYSMILTGAAFLHKDYLYAYTHYMPSIIRRKVDEWMNCEDLAMNFLVSHLTRLPPIKTTSKWTLKCPTCPETLSDEASHFNERHNCVRFFTQVYGYNPLLFTQIRADSVLFKTRVPPNHQKCFRYV